MLHQHRTWKCLIPVIFTVRHLQKYDITPNYYYLEQFITKLEDLGLKKHRDTIFRNFCGADPPIIGANIRESKGAHTYDDTLIDNIINNKSIHSLISNSYLQSHKYFHDYEIEIQELFSPDETVHELYPQLKEDNTINISIHLRLEWGAGVTYKNDYYKDALLLLENKYENSSLKFNIFVFSDNLSKAKQILSPLNKPFIYCENNPDYMDMWIMSLCNHNIICHSTMGGGARI